MNNGLEETKTLIKGLVDKHGQTNNRIVVAPPFTTLQVAVEEAKGSHIEIAAQNMHFEENGAYTGEISASMLKSIGVKTVILGHSERRAYFNETDEMLSKKVSTAIKHGMDVFFCVGEALRERKVNKHFDVVQFQLEKGVLHLDKALWNHIVIAYEPVWAIGTGETATPEQAQEMHEFIRRIIAKKYDQSLANDISTLYGGSVNPSNAKEIFSKPDVDGGLIGGASLKATDFLSIVDTV
ncbi:triosephosphate isomerase [Elysia marginata]|uniref:Triosephosphate isomerase n=1 Tax=Elysia marginata TaxID=1093978 RepID=A0AAV4H126_9GAST|nr:triosephosphate isomerase [Elysia marginata]